MRLRALPGGHARGRGVRAPPGGGARAASSVAGCAPGAGSAGGRRAARAAPGGGACRYLHTRAPLAGRAPQTPPLSRGPRKGALRRRQGSPRPHLREGPRLAAAARPRPRPEPEGRERILTPRAPGGSTRPPRLPPRPRPRRFPAPSVRLPAFRASLGVTAPESRTRAGLCGRDAAAQELRADPLAGAGLRPPGRGCGMPMPGLS